MRNIVVVGAGQAGAALAQKLRREGFDGAITLVGEEPEPPYQRPPLSKDYLLGRMDKPRLYLRPESHYADIGITLLTGRRVTGLDRAAGRLELDDGQALPFDALALTTGAAPRRLPAALGGNRAGVFTVRTIADVDAMAPHFRAGARVLVVGGGYIGLEAAAVAAQKGLEVILVEAAERILQRVACRQTADHFRALHRAHGVDIREGVQLAGLEGAGGPEAPVEAARLADGTRLEVDFVIVGIGVDPRTELARAAGLAIDNGIRTDAEGRSSDPAIWAAGDCASFPWHGRRIRLESVQNAIDQAETVALNMLGRNVPYRPVPWFWSDQYDVKLQIAGLGHGHDRIVTRRSENGGISFWYYRGSTLLAVDAMNDPRAYMVGKRLLEARRSPAPEQVADPAVDLKTLLRP